jgi:hypothetical protein
MMKSQKIVVILCKLLYVRDKLNNFTIEEINDCLAIN